jgi:hypothetical protein
VVEDLRGWVERGGIGLGVREVIGQFALSRLRGED